MFSNILGNKSNIYERNWSKLDQENSIIDYFSVDWSQQAYYDNRLIMISKLAYYDILKLE